MRSDQLGESSREYFDQPGYSYGLGVRTLINREEAGSKSPIGEFGWGGAAGAYALIDVENQLAIFYAQHVLGCEYTSQVVQPKIRNLAYDLLHLS
jgi:CubicO group peptidase (beta-lactamase class C family)